MTTPVPHPPVRALWLIKGLGRGGAEHLVLRSLPLVDRRRVEVEVAYLLPWKDALVPDIEATGTTVHCLGATRSLDPRWTIRLRALVRERGIDIVHTHLPYAGVGARLTVPRRLPLVHTEHNTWARYRPTTRLANRATIGRNSTVIAVSEAVAASIRVPIWARRHPEVRVIIHGIDTGGARQGPDARDHARALLGLPSDALVVGTVGNLTDKKAHDTLLAAFAATRARVPEAHLVIVGDGPLREKLETLASSLGVADHVTFAGSRGDVFELLPGFDVFALSSRHEGLPIALIEALASALPCVCTTVGGVPEVVVDGREGLLVPPADPEAFSSALAALLLDPDQRAEMASRAAARGAVFGLRPSVAAVQAMYETLLRR